MLIVVILILALCASSFAEVFKTDDFGVAEQGTKGMFSGTDLEGKFSHGDTGYTVVLEQELAGVNGTRTKCIGLIYDAETIITSAKCKIALSDEAANSSHKISYIAKSALGVGPLASQVLRVKPPMNLSPTFKGPPLIDNIQEYDDIINQDKFGIVIATTGPKMGLVRWYDQMKSDEGVMSICEENYSTLQKKNPEWPEFLPSGIFCIRGGDEEDNYVLKTRTGENVTIRAGIPCDDSIGSPIVIPNKGVFGLVTFPKCPKQLKTGTAMIFAQAMAFIMPAGGFDYEDVSEASYIDTTDAEEEYFYRMLQTKSQNNEKKARDANTARVRGSTKAPISGCSPTNICGFHIVFSIWMLFKVIMI